MKCSKCGYEIFVGVKCPSCGQVNDDNTTQATSKPTSTTNTSTYISAYPLTDSGNTNFDTYKDDSVSIALCLLSFFVPIFGIIYWFITRWDTPKKAAMCGIASLVAYGISGIISLIMIAF